MASTGTYVDPDSVLARTAREMVEAHAGGAGPREGMTICPVCGEPLPCPSGRAAAEVLFAAGLAEASGLVAASRQGMGPSPVSPLGLAPESPGRQPQSPGFQPTSSPGLSSSPDLQSSWPVAGDQAAQASGYTSSPAASGVSLDAPLSGPALSGPALSGPALTDPAVSGPAASGPAATAFAGDIGAEDEPSGLLFSVPQSGVSTDEASALAYPETAGAQAPRGEAEPVRQPEAGVDPLLLGPPLYARQNRPLDAPMFRPSARAGQVGEPGGHPQLGEPYPQPGQPPQPGQYPEPGRFPHPGEPAQPNQQFAQPGQAAPPGPAGHPTHAPLEAPERGQLNRAFEGAAQPAARPPLDAPQTTTAPAPAGQYPAVGHQTDTAPVARPPREAPETAQPSPPSSEAPQMTQPNRPSLEAPQPGQVNRPPLGAPQAGQANRPPLEAPQMGQVNRPPLEAPQMGQVNRPPVEAVAPGGSDDGSEPAEAPSGLPAAPATAGPGSKSKGIHGVQRPGSVSNPSTAPSGLAGLGDSAAHPTAAQSAPADPESAPSGLPGTVPHPESAPSGLPGAMPTLARPEPAAGGPADDEEEAPSGLPPRSAD